MKSWFKYLAVSIGLIAAIALIAVLYGIYYEMNYPKYHIEGNKVMNVKTGQIYIYVGRRGYLYYDKNGQENYITRLP